MAATSSGLLAYIDQAAGMLGINAANTRPVQDGQPAIVEGTFVAEEEATNGGIWGFLDRLGDKVGEGLLEYTDSAVDRFLGRQTFGPEARHTSQGDPADQSGVRNLGNGLPAGSTTAGAFDIRNYTMPLLIAAAVLVGVLVVKRL